MADTIPKVTQGLLSSQIKKREPSGRYKIDPCGPEVTSIDSSELTVLFPKTKDSERKTVPLMGGSIVKISLGSEVDSEDKRLLFYNKSIKDKITENLNFEEIEKIEKKSTSALRVSINKILVDSISAEQNIGVVPNVYLSTTTDSFDTIQENKDNFYSIRKNLIFGFLPIESIISILKEISIGNLNGNEVTSTIGGWSGLSGNTYKELYDISIKKDPSDDEISKLIMDIIPFLNISSKEMLDNPKRPALGGYYTVIGRAIYLKMPDISGFDSAGFGDDYISASELNLLFQLINTDAKSGENSLKNIELKKSAPIYATIADAKDDYNLKIPEAFTIDFTANEKPDCIYLSPAISDNVDIKNDNIRLIRASQSGNFIEYNPYPNPFVSIFDGKIVLDFHLDEKSEDLPFSKITAKNIDEPFYKVRYYVGDSNSQFALGGLGKIRSFIDKKYNRGLYGETYKEGSTVEFSLDQNIGDIGNYISQILSYSPNAVGVNIEDYFSTGFPFVQELFQKNQNVIGQTISAYEFVGSLSRENLILHHGKSYDDGDPESSGKLLNNLKYFNKNFIANKVGLCQGYRPRVFSSPSKKSFVPKNWIKSNLITGKDGVYKAEFSASDILKFYNNSASDLRFVAYAYDGDCQISKFDNGYIKTSVPAPEISIITPDGFKNGGIILKCDNPDLNGESEIRITSDSAKDINSIKIGDIEIKKENFKAIGPNYIDVIIPCNVGIVSGKINISISASGNVSLPYKIYIANTNPVSTVVVNPQDLPKKEDDQDLFTEEEVSPANLKISGQNYEIPISYIDPRSRIVIKSSKSMFKDGRKIYLYIGVDAPDVASQISQSVASINKDNKNIFIAKDFSYELSESLSSDFYRSSKRKAFLYFPGNGNINRPVGLLTKNIDKAYLILSTKNSSNFSENDVLGVLELGKDQTPEEPARKPFVGPPLVIGIAGKYYDSVFKNHLNNFLGNPRYSSIAEKILKEELSAPLNSNELVAAQDKFKKLIVLFKYRDIKKYAKKRLNLYIKDKKVTKRFSLEGAKRAYDELSFDNALDRFYAKELYYFVISDAIISTSDYAEVRADIYDADFLISTTTRDKYIDYSFRVKNSDVSKNEDTKSIYLNTDFAPAELKNEGTLFGDYQNERALTGFFLQFYTSNIFNFNSFPPVAINSNISSKLHEKESLDSSEIKISLLKNSDSSLISSLPNSYVTISSGAEIYNTEYISGENDYLVYYRLKVIDICKIPSLAPVIVKVTPSDVIIPGSKVELEVENLLNYFALEIGGVKAKITSVESIGIGKQRVIAIVPKIGIDLIPVDKCGMVVYNGTQILEGGINQLGKYFTDMIERAAAGALAFVNVQFEKFKALLKEHPIRFGPTTMMVANLAKQFATSFCEFSFKIVADLKFHLDGFSQLLIPISVIFCIIDVICNLFNPFQLPLAIIRLFECLYDLILLLPQISIPVMLFNILIHMLDFLECLIVKITNLVIAINLIIEAFNLAFLSETVNFRELMVLEELILKYVISLEADIDLMEPIVQVLAIFMQLLGLTFRFPCSINPNSLAAPCGIDGFELGAMISGLIAEQSGSAPHIKYKFDKKYLIPIAQPFTSRLSENTDSGPSYSYSYLLAEGGTTEPDRGAVAIPGTTTEETIYDSMNFNEDSMRSKNSSFNPESDNPSDLSTDTCVSLKASYTKRRKSLGSAQSVIFKFDERTWESTFSSFDRQIIDENQCFDTPITLLTKDGIDLKFAASSSYGNFYSLIDMKSMMTTPTSDGTASIRPLTLDIVQNGITVERTFDTIPSMVLLDDDFNVYIIEEDGIIFKEYDTLSSGAYSGATVLGIGEIRATLINQKSASTDAYSKEDEVVGVDDDGREITNDIFSMPQLYFVDTRVAAEAIQAKCETASINQLPLDMSGDGGLSEIEKVTTCINDFLSSVRLQTTDIKNSLDTGVLPKTMSQDTVNNAYLKLIDCTNDSIGNLCSIVINSLNTSFKLLGDTDETPILPDPVSSSESVTGGIISGPAFTGAREYAGGIGDAVSVPAGSSTSIYLLPRDVYDNRIYYDVSSKSRIDIISDTTDGARLVLYPTDSNPQNYWQYNSTEGSYYAAITSSSPGIVKIRAVICGSPVQALTYSDLVTNNSGGDSGTGCLDSDVEAEDTTASTPLGALSRIDRILTITFTEKEGEITTVVTSLDSSGSIITEPQLFATNMEN